MGLIESDIDATIDNLRSINLSGKCVLVTGGAGFLGSWLCHVLTRLNARVICLDNLSSGLQENICHLLDMPNFEFIKHNITQPISFSQKIDLVMHLASRASPFEFEKFPLEILKANTLGTMLALEIALEYRARFLYTSTSEIYGNPSQVPTPESYRGNVNPIGVRSCYNEGKRCGEAMVMAYHKQYRLDVRIARIFNTYGPRMRGDDIYGRVVPRFIDQALNGEAITIFGTGKQTRSFCYITDQIGGLLRLACLLLDRDRVINIGNNHEASIMELADIIRRLTGSSSGTEFQPLPEDDPTRRCPDITKAQEVLGWKPKVNLENGLSKMIQWVRQSKKNASPSQITSTS